MIITRFKHRRIIAGCTAFIIFVSANSVQAQTTPFGEDAFRGCIEKTAAPKTSPTDDTTDNSLHTQILVASESEARAAARALASFGSFASVESTTTEKDVAFKCWARLDGVWREDTEITLDTSVNPKGWESDLPESISLANGTFTDARHLMIAHSETPEKALTIIDVRKPDDPAIFISSDKLSLDTVLKRGGPRKKYISQAKNSLGAELLVDLTRTGRLRLKLDGKFYYRPPPGGKSNISRADFEQKQDADNAFLVSFNLDNMTASRKGYDVSSQDAFYLLNNPKSEVFSLAAQNAFIIDEKRTVPLGFILVQDGSQGMVYRKTLISSAAGFQESVSEAYGYKTTFGTDMTPVQAAVGADFSNSQVDHMRSSQSVSQALAFARQKVYALVVDQPYVTLSGPFIEAIEDARRYGDKDQSYYRDIIKKFGTHYPYAVTYGSTAKVARNFSKQEYSESAIRSDGFALEASGRYFGPGGQGHYSKLVGSESEFRQSMSDEGATFVAVGGSGSFDESGFSGGTPYPILLDTRPLDELLSPLNFPDSPEVYTKVRGKLRQAIVRYLGSKANTLSSVSLAPRTRVAGDYINKRGSNTVVRFGMKDKNTLGYQWRNVTREKRFNSPQYIARKGVNRFYSKPLGYTLANDGSVVEHLDNQEDKVWHDANADWYPSSREVSGVFQVEYDPKATLTFDSIYKNMMLVTQSWSETGKAERWTRKAFDSFAKGQYSYTLNPNGTVTWSDAKKEIPSVTYYPVDEPLFLDAPEISGDWLVAGNTKAVVTIKTINPNYYEITTTWTDGVERWQRTGPKTLTSRSGTRYELLDNGKLRWHSPDGKKTRDHINKNAPPPSFVQFGK